MNRRDSCTRALFLSRSSRYVTDFQASLRNGESKQRFSLFSFSLFFSLIYTLSSTRVLRVRGLRLSLSLSLSVSLFLSLSFSFSLSVSLSRLSLYVAYSDTESALASPFGRFSLIAASLSRPNSLLCFTVLKWPHCSNVSKSLCIATRKSAKSCLCRRFKVISLTLDSGSSGNIRVPGKLVAFYFSAAWCGPCTHFTSILKVHVP